MRKRSQVIIVGGVPVGVGLAVDLGLRGISCTLVERRLGMRVEVFSIGFGPRIAGIRRGETEYRLSAFPLGGYCKIAGFSPDEPAATERREDTEWHPDGDGDEERADRDLEAVGDALADHLDDRAVVVKGVAEIELDDVPQPRRELEWQRVVQAERLT